MDGRVFGGLQDTGDVGVDAHPAVCAAWPGTPVSVQMARPSRQPSTSSTAGSLPGTNRLDSAAPNHIAAVQAVTPAPALHVVASALAAQLVVPHATGETVAAIAAVDVVVTSTAAWVFDLVAPEHLVVPQAALDDVEAGTAGDAVVVGAAAQAVIAVVSAQVVLPAAPLIVSSPPRRRACRRRLRR